MKINRGGFGGEAFGDPMGGGGGLHLVRAIAVGGQIVRAVFNKAPKTKSSAASNDGLNGGNYIVTITTGTGAAPQIIGTTQVVPYPAYGVFQAGEVGIDVHADRPLVVGLTYSLRVATRMVAEDGDTMGYPYVQSFIGASRPTRLRRKLQVQGMADFASGQNGLQVSGGDIDVATDIPSTKIRCMRRAVTMKGAFAHLPGYGIGFQPKAPLSVNRAGSLKADLAQQLKLEPDVQDAASNVQMDARGFVTVDLRIRTKQNQVFTFNVSTSNS